MIDYPSEDQAEQIIKALIEKYPNVMSRLKEFEDELKLEDDTVRLQGWCK